MRRRLTETQGRMLLAILIVALVVVTVVFGFILNKPTSSAGLGVIITFVILILFIIISYLFYSRRGGTHN